ncbi:hypothetical protein NQ176_g9057 [Zarea fungicola]|uniref:Uncharacterized protein n=1 Tax=Zarea fungicola TaxID=93591 RepID=A0ACC1MPT4_9HYPO|nr:hypothetical protein NQ176_g9057 [Lecanicillium fungicola]
MSAKSDVPSKTDSILVIGAGIFGLSTAIHLAERGHPNVTLLDKQPYEKTLYSYANGCDAASADINKIIRSAYGSQKIYQTLSLEAIDTWNTWTQELRRGGSAVPPGMTSQDDLWINNGDLSCTDMDDLSEQEKATIRSMESAGYRDTQLINNNSRHLRLATEKGFGSNMQPFGKAVLGVLDTTGGVAFADKACRFALHKAQKFSVSVLPMGRRTEPR